MGVSIRNQEDDPQQASTLFSSLNEKADLVFKFVTLYNDYMSEKHDYGTGQLINMVEVHTLTAIEENPGITITELAGLWNRTSSALSQTATKLEKKGYIVRIKSPDNARNNQLFVTESGRELSLAHKAYDVENVTGTLNELLETCSVNEVADFFKVITSYIHLLEDPPLPTDNR